MHFYNNFSSFFFMHAANKPIISNQRKGITAATTTTTKKKGKFRCATERDSAENVWIEKSSCAAAAQCKRSLQSLRWSGIWKALRCAILWRMPWIFQAKHSKVSNFRRYVVCHIEFAPNYNFDIYLGFLHTNFRPQKSGVYVQRRRQMHCRCVATESMSGMSIF